MKRFYIAKYMHGKNIHGVKGVNANYFVLYTVQESGYYEKIMELEFNSYTNSQYIAPFKWHSPKVEFNVKDIREHKTLLNSIVNLDEYNVNDSYKYLGYNRAFIQLLRKFKVKVFKTNVKFDEYIGTLCQIYEKNQEIKKLQKNIK